MCQLRNWHNPPCQTTPGGLYYIHTKGDRPHHTQTTMNIKALISSAFIGAASIFGGVTSAEAGGHYCYYNTNDAHLCVYNVRGDRYNKTYDLNINGRYVGRQSVWCNPAHRYTYKANANGIACFEFN